MYSKKKKQRNETPFRWSRVIGYGAGVLVFMGCPLSGQAQAVAENSDDSTSGNRSAETVPASEPALEPATNEPLVVGIGGTPPFLIREGDDYRGIILDLWQQIAVANNFEYELVLQTQTQAAFDAIETGELDLLIGPFSITSQRLQRVDFTQPFFTAGVGVVLPQEPPTLWSRVRPFFTTAALSSVGGLLVCLFLVGNFMWLAERKQNPEQFPHKYAAGVGHGMWFALVTLTTVGYGDRAPATPLGRFIASIWMLISLIAVSSLVGGLATAFTLALSETSDAQISSPTDLRGKQIAVVAGSTGEAWARTYGARLIEKSRLREAVALVAKGRADGAVFDRPALEYYLSQRSELPLRLADFTLSSENFGFVLPYDSPIEQPLNLSLVRLRENGTIDTISDRWLQGIDSSEEAAPATE